MRKVDRAASAKEHLLELLFLIHVLVLIFITKNATSKQAASAAVVTGCFLSLFTVVLCQDGFIRLTYAGYRCVLCEGILNVGSMWW